MRHLVTSNLLVVFLFLGAFPLTVPAADEYFSDFEIEQIREAQEIERRIPILLTIAETRLVYLGLRETPEKKGSRAGKVAKALVSVFQPGLAADIKKTESDAKEQAEESDAQLTEFTRTELLRGFYQALEEAMDNIDDAYERKRGNIRGPLEELKKFIEEHLPALRRFDAESRPEESAWTDAIEQANLALEGSKTALKIVPKTPGNN